MTDRYRHFARIFFTKNKTFAKNSEFTLNCSKQVLRAFDTEGLLYSVQNLIITLPSIKWRHMYCRYGKELQSFLYEFSINGTKNKYTILLGSQYMCHPNMTTGTCY